MARDKIELKNITDKLQKEQREKQTMYGTILLKISHKNVIYSDDEKLYTFQMTGKKAVCLNLYIQFEYVFHDYESSISLADIGHMSVSKFKFKRSASIHHLSGTIMIWEKSF